MGGSSRDSNEVRGHSEEFCQSAESRVEFVQPRRGGNSPISSLSVVTFLTNNGHRLGDVQGSEVAFYDLFAQGGEAVERVARVEIFKVVHLVASEFEQVICARGFEADEFVIEVGFKGARVKQFLGNMEDKAAVANLRRTCSGLCLKSLY